MQVGETRSAATTPRRTGGDDAYEDHGARAAAGKHDQPDLCFVLHGHHAAPSVSGNILSRTGEHDKQPICRRVSWHREKQRQGEYRRAYTFWRVTPGGLRRNVFCALCSKYQIPFAVTLPSPNPPLAQIHGLRSICHAPRGSGALPPPSDNVNSGSQRLVPAAVRTSRSMEDRAAWPVAAAGMRLHPYPTSPCRAQPPPYFSSNTMLVEQKCNSCLSQPRVKNVACAILKIPSRWWTNTIFPSTPSGSRFRNSCCGGWTSADPHDFGATVTCWQGGGGLSQSQPLRGSTIPPASQSDSDSHPNSTADSLRPVMIFADFLFGAQSAHRQQLSNSNFPVPAVRLPDVALLCLPVSPTPTLTRFVPAAISPTGGSKSDPTQSIPVGTRRTVQS
eukprot:gene24213-biopygen8924